ncbi:MAG TPA: S1C family serine protease [Anaerolineales bacterium]|nr:S1C family serine protease [Anaerolineales bacterium]
MQTNNHVVTGAAIVEVKMSGEVEARNARILGVSECSDLAVIDIEGEGFPYLEWYDEPITVGTDVYAAGFPLGDPEYTLTRGIVSKEHANGEVAWASVEYVIEHDANINPGNSGGPLVAADGRVVGVNYASYEVADQSFAISRDEALEILDELQAGQNLYSIGVNGLAVSDGKDLSGIWVSSIKSGSPADDAGLEPGDIITEMEGMTLATDGTMAAYCDILRTHSADDTLSIEVIRLETKEVFKGQVNGRRLEMISALAEKESELSAAGSHEGSYSEYVTASDDLNMMEIEIPAAWSEVDGSPWVSGGEMFGVSISAAADLESFYNSWSESGVFFGASHKLARLAGYVQVLDAEREYFSQDCQLEGRYDYNDAMYRGKYDVWNNCGGTEATVIVISAVPKDNPTEYLIWWRSSSPRKRT